MNQIEKDLEKLSKERELLVAKFSDSTMDNQEISVINKRLTEIQDLLDQKNCAGWNW